METRNIEVAQRDLYPIPEARFKLGGISNSKFYEIVKDGKISISKIGQRSFVAGTEIKRFIDSLELDVAV